MASCLHKLPYIGLLYVVSSTYFIAFVGCRKAKGISASGRLCPLTPDKEQLGAQPQTPIIRLYRLEPLALHGPPLSLLSCTDTDNISNNQTHNNQENIHSQTKQLTIRQAGPCLNKKPSCCWESRSYCVVWDSRGQQTNWGYSRRAYRILNLEILGWGVWKLLWVGDWASRRALTCYSLVQTLLPKDVSFSHNAQRHRQTDGQTDDIIMPVADHHAACSTID